MSVKMELKDAVTATEVRRTGNADYPWLGFGPGWLLTDSGPRRISKDGSHRHKGPGSLEAVATDHGADLRFTIVRLEGRTFRVAGQP